MYNGNGIDCKKVKMESGGKLGKWWDVKVCGTQEKCEIERENLWAQDICKLLFPFHSSISCQPNVPSYKASSDKYIYMCVCGWNEM